MSSYKFKNKDLDNAIITDAGFEEISYKDALEYFTEKEISNYWQNNIKDLEVEEIAIELGITLPIQKNNEDVYQEALEEMFEMMPNNIQVILAKAVYKEKNWVSVLSLPTFESDFSRHEYKSIILGLMLQKELNQDLEIVNDCKSAVLRFKNNSNLSIFWSKRNNTKKAHNLRLFNANKIIDITSLNNFNKKISNLNYDI